MTTYFYRLKLKKASVLFFFILHFCFLHVFSQNNNLREIFKHPPSSAKPWVFWYWMYGAVSREGITADLEAMQQAGIGGAYIFTIKDIPDTPLFIPSIRQLTDEWWEMIIYALNEAKRLGLKIGFHSCDGFTVAGGPWITGELSMQKVVWSKIMIRGGQYFCDTLPQPETTNNYYRDIAVFAFPAHIGESGSTINVAPKVTTSIPGIDAQFLVQANNTKVFRSDEPCWIQYEFEQPFTCQSLKLHTRGNNLQAQRLLIETSNDGIAFTKLIRLKPPRHGWQDAVAEHTYSIPPVTARYFRFVYDKEGTEPGSEDLDAAKWKQSLKITGIELLSSVCIDQYEGKSGIVWRISERTSPDIVPDSLCIPLDKIINLTDKLGNGGFLEWDVPEGQWIILRMGHTSTGTTNYMGGAATGLECDKFNPLAVELQFNKWFGELARRAGNELVPDVLKIFHVDSWECGSQNWSPVFRDEFRKRRGYDIIPYLPVYAGVPVENTRISEKVLSDVRQTIGELVCDNFFGTLKKLLHKYGCDFSAESIAPVMTGDGMQHFGIVDIPMGEFWLHSPTHDKPNDILDAVSAGHVYGKNIIQAEAFTTLRMAWNEYPGMLKPTGDYHFTTGINRLVFHVFTHNPWLDKKPGMTLDGVGLYFQRDQTWWKHTKAYLEYIMRCQTMLQQGHDVADIAVFTGEETPSRSLTPDKLVDLMPGLIGKERTEKEKIRLKNAGIPMQEIPEGVISNANIFNASEWINPLRGYKYDSFNKDALLKLARVENKRIILPGGASYALLVIPGKNRMPASGRVMSEEVAGRIMEMIDEGATVMLFEPPCDFPGLTHNEKNDSILRQFNAAIWDPYKSGLPDAANRNTLIHNIGKGKVLIGPYNNETLNAIGIERDFIALDSSGSYLQDIGYTHRTSDSFDIYFVFNKRDEEITFEVSFRTAGRIPELWDPLTGECKDACEWRTENNRTVLPLRLEAHGSVFVVFMRKAKVKNKKSGKNWYDFNRMFTVYGNWKVLFDSAFKGPEDTIIFENLTDWSLHPDPHIKYFSGTATYYNNFIWNKAIRKTNRVWLDLGIVADIAEVRINGISCGTVWTYPFRVEITNAIRKGNNHIEINVTNTWANRLIGDYLLSSEENRITYICTPVRYENIVLTKAGLIGPVEVNITRIKRGRLELDSE